MTPFDPIEGLGGGWGGGGGGGGGGGVNEIHLRHIIFQDLLKTFNLIPNMAVFQG